MHLNLILAACIYFVASAVAQQPVWAQCGGINWTGGTTCASGTICVKLNDYYYQCQPGSAASPSQSTVTTTPTATTQPATRTATSTTSTAAAATGTQIRAVQDPVFHLYLQNSNGTPVLAAEATSGRFIINGSIALVSGSTRLYLNVNAGTASYKPLTFDTTASSINWGLEGDTIITTNASPYGRQLNFLACTTSTSGSYRVYLQTGNDTPSGSTCSTITLHLPCLC